MALRVLLKFSFLLLPLLSAFAAYLAFPPINFYPLAFVMLAPLFIFLEKEKTFWKLVLGAFLFRFAYGYFLTYYVFDLFLYLQSILIFLGLPIAVYFLKKVLTGRYYLSIIGVLYLIFDYWEAKYTLISAFVAHIGNALGMSPFVGLARWGGLWGLGIFTISANILIAGLVLNSARRWRNRLIIFLTLIGLGLMISQLILKNNQKIYELSSKELNFASVSVDRFFDQDQSELANQINKIKNQLGNGNFDLIVFPEALFELEVSDGQEDSRLNVYQKLAEKLKSNILINVSLQKASGRYNSNLLINRDGVITQEYDKNDLILGGEYWPRWFERVTGSQSRYQFGREAKIFSLDGRQNFATLICFEGHLPKRLNDYAKRGAAFFVNSSSNKWIEDFDDSGLRRYLRETLSLRRIYAVWLRKPFIIGGRRDYAGVILPDGRLDVLDFDPPAGYNVYKGRLKI